MFLRGGLEKILMFLCGQVMESGMVWSSGDKVMEVKRKCGCLWRFTMCLCVACEAETGRVSFTPRHMTKRGNKRRRPVRPT